MEARMQQAVQQIVAEQEQWIKALAERAEQLESSTDAAAFERQLREQGLRQLGRIQQQLLQARLDATREAGRRCPHCQQRRRHKGRRPRTLVGLLGPMRLEGVQWHCDCGAGGEHAARRLYADSISPPLRELMCLLGIDGSFREAERRCRKLLGVALSAQTIRRVSEAEGERLAEQPATCERPVCGQLIGSCDGTMVHTREDGWRELRAYRFDDDRGRRLSGATLERSDAFVPRLRKLALSQHADRVKRFTFVSDAAEWIAQAVDEFLPEASDHVIDIYHAYQHIYEAARAIHGEGTDAAARWARRWCERLKRLGGRWTWDRLRCCARFTQPHQQEALNKLLGYLNRHAQRMDYPRYQRQGIPISSGPIESTCKQLGLRLKGPGMRWARRNVTPLARLVSLWKDDHWDTHWQAAA